MNDVSKLPQTARQLAEKEFAAEQRKEDVIRFKELLSKKAKAEKIVAAIQAEIDDLEAELSDG